MLRSSSLIWLIARGQLEERATTNNWIIACVSVVAISLGCAEKKEQVRSDTVPIVPASETSAPSPVAIAPVGRDGAGLIVDGAQTAPSITETGDQYQIRIPTAMAKVLHDSLPGFTPLPRSAFDSSVIKWVDSHEREAAPLSVVIGDFDGDSRLDIAMMGTSLDSVARIMLLARPAPPQNTQLFFLGPPQLATPQYLQSQYLAPLQPSRLPNGFELRTAGVKSVVFDKTEVLFYLDQGSLRRAFTSDD